MVKPIGTQNWRLEQHLKFMASPRVNMFRYRCVLRPPETLTLKDAVSFSVIEMIFGPGPYETFGPPDHPDPGNPKIKIKIHYYTITPCIHFTLLHSLQEKRSKIEAITSKHILIMGQF